MRGLDSKFLAAMREGLENGRRQGYVGWDKYWENVAFSTPPTAYLFKRLHQEIDELVVAVKEGDPKQILHEAADAANFCMFIADICKDDET